MEAQHSPGPWRLGGTYDDMVFAANGIAVATKVYSGTIGLDQEGANLDLIVAAPDLLEACIALLNARHQRRRIQ